MVKGFAKMRKHNKKVQRRQGLKQSAGKVCNQCGKCCHGFHITIPHQSEDMKKYFEYHNCSVDIVNGKPALYIKNVCNHLGADGKCAIYETRPIFCKKSYIELRKGIFYPEGCTLK